MSNVSKKIHSSSLHFAHANRQTVTVNIPGEIQQMFPCDNAKNQNSISVIHKTSRHFCSHIQWRPLETGFHCFYICSVGWWIRTVRGTVCVCVFRNTSQTQYTLSTQTNGASSTVIPKLNVCNRGSVSNSTWRCEDGRWGEEIARIQQAYILWRHFYAWMLSSVWAMLKA